MRRCDVRASAEARHRNSVLGSDADLQFLGQLNTQAQGVWNNEEPFFLGWFLAKENAEFDQRTWEFGKDEDLADENGDVPNNKELTNIKWNFTRFQQVTVTCMTNKNQDW